MTQTRNASRRQHYSSGTVWEELAGYSRAVRIGDRILVAGTTATGPAGEVIGGADPAVQARYILDKIEVALRQLGGQLSDVVRTRIYLRNANDWEAVARAHGERFGAIRPVNTLVEAKLIGEEYLVEIEAEAVVSL